MANSLNDEVVSFDSALREASVFRNLIFLVHQNRNKKKQLLHWFWKESTGRIAKWLWEKPDSGVGSYQRYYDECSCRFPAPTYCLWWNGKTSSAVVCASKCRSRSIGRKTVKEINGSHTQRLSFRKYRVQEKSAHIYDRKPFCSWVKKKTLPFLPLTLYGFFFKENSVTGF